MLPVRLPADVAVSPGSPWVNSGARHHSTEAQQSRVNVCWVSGVPRVTCVPVVGRLCQARGRRAGGNGAVGGDAAESTDRTPGGTAEGAVWQGRRQGRREERRWKPRGNREGSRASRWSSRPRSQFLGTADTSEQNPAPPWAVLLPSAQGKPEVGARPRACWGPLGWARSSLRRDSAGAGCGHRPDSGRES